MKKLGAVYTEDELIEEFAREDQELEYMDYYFDKIVGETQSWADVADAGAYARERLLREIIEELEQKTVILYTDDNIYYIGEF